MTHQIFIGVSKNIIAAGFVLFEIEFIALENSDQPGEFIYHFFAAAQLGLVVKMGIVDYTAEIVLPGFCQLGNDFVHFFADVFIALQGNQIVETAAFWNSDIRIFYTFELVRDILHEQQGQDIVLILRGVHAASQFIAARPKGTIQLIFLYRHVCLPHFS